MGIRVREVRVYRQHGHVLDVGARLGARLTASMGMCWMLGSCSTALHTTWCVLWSLFHLVRGRVGVRVRVGVRSGLGFRV